MKRKLLAIIILAFTFSVSACQLPFFGKDSVSVSYDTEVIRATVERSEETLIAIRVLETDEGETLSDVMAYLQAKEEFTYTENEGMITAINGKQNASDWSYCWMLYTSDAEMANASWGVLEYSGDSLGSAVLGMDALPVTKGAVYVWSYTGF